MSKGVKDVKVGQSLVRRSVHLAKKREYEHRIHIIEMIKKKRK